MSQAEKTKKFFAPRYKAVTFKGIEECLRSGSTCLNAAITKSSAMARFSEKKSTGHHNV